MPTTPPPRAGVTRLPVRNKTAVELDSILRRLRASLFARQMFLAIPDTRVISEGFVRHIGTELTFPKLPFFDLRSQGSAPLAEDCLRLALEAVSSSLEAGEIDRQRHFVLYVKALLKDAPEVMGIEASYPGGGIWDPLGPTPYSDWAKARPASVPFITVRDRDLGERAHHPRRPEVRTRLLARIAPPDLLVRIQRFIPEIVAYD